MPHMPFTTQPYLVTLPFVDLTLQPYRVVADDTALATRQQNTAGIKAAIADFSGTNAVLILPLGSVYVEEDSAQWCVKFGTGVSKLSLVGYGVHATKLVQYTVGDSGEQDLIIIDGASDIEIASMTLEQHTITNPDPAQQNHLLCIYNNTLGGTTKNIRGRHLRFGKCIGDAIRLLAADSSDKVQNVWFDDFEIHGNGVVTSTPANGRTGARSGIAIQRGPEDCVFSNFYIRGVQNSAIDEEPSGGACRRVWYQNGIIDNTISNSGTPVSLGGSGGGDIAYDGRLTNVHIIGGKLSMLGGTSGYRLRDVTIDVTASMPADATDPLVIIRSGSGGHDDLEIVGLRLRRTGGTAGPCLDIVNTGNRTKIRDLHIEQATNGYPFAAEHNGMLDVDGYRLKFSGATPASYRALDVIPVASGGTLADLRIANVSAVTASGKLHSVVSIQSRASRTVSKIKVRDIRSAGYASNGVYVSATAGTIDTTPEVSGIDNGSDTAFSQNDQSDAPTTTLFPILAGNRNAPAIYQGTGAPSHTAARGSLYLRIDDGALYSNTDGGTTWAAR